MANAVGVQYQSSISGIINSNQNISFDTALLTDPSIAYSTSTQQFTLSETGIYIVSWWVSIQASSSRYASFAINYSGNILQANSPNIKSLLSGSAILNVSSPNQSIFLVNTSSESIKLGVETPITANISIFKASSSTELLNLLDGNSDGSLYGINSPPNYDMGPNAVSLGNNTVASGTNSFTCGTGTTASGTNSFAYGDATTASNNNSFAGGDATEASGIDSFAIGRSSTASGSYSFAGGDATEASGTNSFTCGTGTTAIGTNSFASGNGTTASNNNSFAGGDATESSGIDSFAIGRSSTASGSYSFAGGDATTASGNNSFAIGRSSTASGSYSFACGDNTVASDDGSFACGNSTTASGFSAHAEGSLTNASGSYAHAQGRSTIADAQYSSAAGLGTTTDNVQGSFVVGEFGGPNNMTVGDTRFRDFSFYVANGTGNNSRSIAASILRNGEAYAQRFNNGGADYGEMFETSDGKYIEPGYFVAFDGNSKIRKANSSDRLVLGVTSKTAGIVGNNNAFNWEGKFLKDKWGELLYNEDMERIINPNYDDSKEFKGREQRCEWVVVGLLGQVLVRDDGSSIEGGYCRVSNEGIATISDIGYPVLKRMDDNQILIMFNSLVNFNNDFVYEKLELINTNINLERELEKTNKKLDELYKYIKDIKL